MAWEYPLDNSSAAGGIVGGAFGVGDGIAIVVRPALRGRSVRRMALQQVSEWVMIVGE